MSGRARMLWVASFFLATALVAIGTSKTHAQSFGFSINSGGHGHHHHHHHGHRGGWSVGYGFGPYWGPAWYGPPAVVYAPPPVVQERVIYVQPPAPAPLHSSPYSSSTPTAPAASLAANSTPSLAGSAANDDRIVIRNMAGAQLPVSFLVDSQDVELTEGATRTFVGKTHRTIQYDRGGRFGSTQQELTGGQYEFRITSSGWDLVRKPDLSSPSRTAIRSNSLPETSASR